MQTRKIDTITNNEDQVRFQIFSGDLQLSAAGAELLRVERAQHEAERQRHMATRDWMGKEIERLRAMLATIAKHPNTPELIKQYARGDLAAVNQQ